MKNCIFIIFFICLLVWLVCCAPRRRKTDNILTFDRRTGEPIAVDKMIQKYEKEHQYFYAEETKNGIQLEWPALNNKNLSNYCKKYIQHSIPSRDTNNATGSQIKVLLNYEKENTKIKSNVIIIHCKIIRKRSLSYYITRAPQSNCVYTLKRTQLNKSQSKFTITFKHCDFEEKPLINRSLKRRREQITGQMNIRTGQPIAKNKYLLQYELEHQEMLRNEGVKGKHITWLHAMTHPNLDIYCLHFVKDCAPARQREGIKGSWQTVKLHYRIAIMDEDTSVTTVKCIQTNGSKLHYYMTKALETNCVYALIRQGPSNYQPLSIIFKHCDFELANVQKVKTEIDEILVKNFVPKYEVHEEKLKLLQTVQLFPKT